MHLRNSAARAGIGKALQFRVRTLCLLVAAVAIFVSYSHDRYRLATLESRIGLMRTLARQLQIHDVNQIAVVQRVPRWYDDNRWEVYLPKGEYRICLGTRGVNRVGRFGLTSVTASERLQSGLHLIAIELEPENGSCRVTVNRAGTTVFSILEPDIPNGGFGMTSSPEVPASKQVAVSDPVVLFRRHFVGSAAPSSPNRSADGALLWIESVKREGSKENGVRSEWHWFFV